MQYKHIPLFQSDTQSLRTGRDRLRVPNHFMRGKGSPEPASTEFAVQSRARQQAGGFLARHAEASKRP
jgi:hypothetical protein